MLEETNYLYLADIKSQLICIKQKPVWLLTRMKCYIVGTGRPDCADTLAIVRNDTLQRFTAGDLSTCTVNDVPATFTYFSVCSSASCLPLDYCLLPQWSVNLYLISFNRSRTWMDILSLQLVIIH